MAFDWMDAKVGRAARERAPERALEAQRGEVRDRARLLMHLGYSKKEATTRCQRYLDWEHELGPGTDVAREVNKLVDEVYARR